MKKCSPRLKLITATSVPETASRSPASRSAVAFAALARVLAGSRTTRREAAGATTCTISMSWTSSPDACQGKDAPARLVTAWIFGAGSRNSLSNAARSCRMSVAVGTAPGGGAPAPGGGPLKAGVPGDWRGASTVTVSPRPSIPRSSKGWMPYAVRNRYGA